MHASVKCPGCQASLRVPSDTAASEYICPRCQGIVPVPPEQIEPAPVVAAPRGTEIVVGSPAPPPLCPNCGKKVERKWRFCPHCDCPLLRDQSPNLDETARAVHKAGVRKSVLLGIMAILGALNFTFGLIVTLSDRNSQTGVLLLLVLLLFCAVLSTWIVYWPKPSRRERPNPYRVLFLTFSILGMLVVGGCSLVLVGWIFLFVYCLAGGRV